MVRGCPTSLVYISNEYLVRRLTTSGLRTINYRTTTLKNFWSYDELFSEPRESRDVLIGRSIDRSVFLHFFETYATIVGPDLEPGRLVGRYTMVPAKLSPAPLSPTPLSPTRIVFPPFFRVVCNHCMPQIVPSYSPSSC